MSKVLWKKGENMKPQRTQRKNTLCPLWEFPVDTPPLQAGYLQYKSKEIGNHRRNILVEAQVIVELKSVDTINRIYEAQLLTYLKAMNKRVGLLIKINFNVERLKHGIRRLIIWEDTGGRE